MKVFNSNYFNELTSQAKANPRLRQHLNIHHSYRDVCQRLFNAIEPGSYIRPHRHLDDDLGGELLVAIRGVMALVIFDDHGVEISITHFGTDRHGSNMTAGVEVPAGIWHTVIALEPSCILLEVKAGPFDPNQPKDLATWAPEENSAAGFYYLSKLVKLAAK